MRQTIKGLVAAFAVMVGGAAPAMACGYGGCSPCANPCETSYAPAYTYAPAYSYAPAYTNSGCGTCGTTAGWGNERLAEPTTQYYYANQGPTYSGPGSYAPYPAYEENAVPAYGARPYYGYGYRHHYRPYYHSYRYGYEPRRYGYEPRHYGYAPRHYGFRYGHEGYEGYYGGRPMVRRYY